LPICPYCKKKVDGKDIKIIDVDKGILKLSRALYVCPHCDYILGAGSNA